VKKHVLSSIGKRVKAINFGEVFYDIKSQISYWDQKFCLPVVSNKNNGPTAQTETIEDSDVDEFALMPPGTNITKTIEDSDADEFRNYYSSTKETRTIETSDPDEFVHQVSPTTKQTFTLENSDVDEFVLG